MPAFKSIGTLAAVALLAACASPGRIAPGSTAAEVRAAAGAPSEERTLPNGQKALYYENGPRGWTTYRVVLDASGRVVSTEQVLTEKNFRDQLTVNKTRRDDVLNSLGKPADVSHYPNIGEEVWTYRYMDVTLEMLNDVHFDAATGVVKSYSMYRDPAYTVNLASRTAVRIEPRG